LKPYLDQLKAVEAAVKHKRGTISMPTGSGKSHVIRLIIERLNLKTLVVVPSLEIKRQLKHTLKGLKNVTVENIDSKALRYMTNFDILIIDECHHVAAKTYQKLNKVAWTKIYYRFLFTATPFRNDSEETLLFEAICGEVIYRLSYADAVKAGYIVPVDAFYVESTKKETEAYTYRQVYNELVVNNLSRNLLLSSLMLKLNGSPTLCLVREVLHGQILSDLTGYPFVSGEDDESRDYIDLFNRGEITTLVGTTGILGEGVDSKPAEYIIIAGLGKAKSQFMQQVGRGVRKHANKESCKVILVKDKSHKFTLRHFNSQASILKEEYGVKPIRIDI